MSKTPKKPSFEEALDQLDRIVASLEDDATPLQESLTLYEAGIVLIERCTRELAETQQTLQVLRKRADGVFELLDANE